VRWPRTADPGLCAPIPLRAGVAVSVGVPYGRLDAATLAALADLAETFADGALRLGPRRLLFVAGATPHGAAAFRAAAEALGLVVHADDPRRRVEACPGAPACASAHGQTRDLADRLAPLVPEGRTLHVSGCAKGCARPAPADLTLVRRPGGGVALVERGRASDPPARTGTEADIPAWIAEHAA
jgi:sulfite reductase beta subunit-like hemoprotein